MIEVRKRVEVLIRFAIAVLSAASSLAGCHGGAAPAGGDPPGGTADIPVSVILPQRYGADANENGVVDMPNTAAWVQAPLMVSLDASDLAGSFPTRWPYSSDADAQFGNLDGPWRWRLTAAAGDSVPQGVAGVPVPASGIAGMAASNDGQTVTTYSARPAITLALFEGEWTLELARMDAAGNAIYWQSAPISIDDVLIVQLGDSWSSGDGSPDRTGPEGYWGDDGAGGNGDHAAAHRSSNSWGSLYAQKLAASQSVTYVNLASSNAAIADVIGTQLALLSAIVGPRKVDQVLVSVGSADAGVMQAIASYLYRDPFPFLLSTPSVAQIDATIRSGAWTGSAFGNVSTAMTAMSNAAWSNTRGLDALATAYDDLANAFATRGIATVSILEYPDPLVANPDDPEAACGTSVLVPGVISRTLRLDLSEQRDFRTNLLQPLNAQIAASATAHGWTTVKAETALYGHAICQDDRMALTFDDSMQTEHGLSGALHPNKAGYAAIADRVAAR